MRKSCKLRSIQLEQLKLKSKLHFEEDFNMQKSRGHSVIASIDVKQRYSSFKSGLLIANFLWWLNNATFKSGLVKEEIWWIIISYPSHFLFHLIPRQQLHALLVSWIKNISRIICLFIHLVRVLSRVEVKNLEWQI